MNILGINGALGWDGNIADPQFISGMGLDFWVHGSGATLFTDGKLMGAICEERMTRRKYDGNYPEHGIKKLLNKNNLKESDIDIVGFVTNPVLFGQSLKRSGYLEQKLKSIFKNSEVIFVDHHKSHACATFLTSGFDNANIFTFDGAGDYHTVDNQEVPNNSSLYVGDFNAKSINHIRSYYLKSHFGGLDENPFGMVYSMYSWLIYNWKQHGVDTSKYKPPTPESRESYPGKIMGLSAYGDHHNVNLPDIFELSKFPDSPVIMGNFNHPHDRLMQYGVSTEDLNQFNCTPEDLASWLQQQFEKYVLFYFSNIPDEIKQDKLCLGGGCALNIITNSRLIEEGIFEDVHVNTAPNDDGLGFGAAIYLAFQNEKELKLPENIGCIGFDYDNDEVEDCLTEFDMEEVDEI